MSTKQSPIHTGFGFRSTAAQVVDGLDLAGQTAIVTGAGEGLGAAVARTLASAGARVIVAARDTAKARQALADVESIEVSTLDLANPDTIERFADWFLNKGSPLHMLVNNAGVMFTPFGKDARGYETQFAINHLGHFELSLRLWPALARARGARIVALSSRGHRYSPVHFDDVNFDRRPYDKFAAYGQSKTAVALFAVGADQRGKADGIRAFSVHPGRIVSTHLSRFMSDEERAAIPMVDSLGQAFDAPEDFIKSIEQGAATSVWCATSPTLDGLGGLYCEDCNIAPVVEPDSQGLGVRPYAIDPVLADQLWSLSERMTGVAIDKSARAA
jgi:NAD(P)-dependent dehydrogenase (short-subunit alcohol dehydrogenase family)